MIHNYRRFGTLRKIWYKALHDQRSRIIKETKVLGYFAADEEDPSIFDKKDPGKNASPNQHYPYPDRQNASPNQNSFIFGGCGPRPQNMTNRNAQGGSPMEHMMGVPQSHGRMQGMHANSPMMKNLDILNQIVNG